MPSIATFHSGWQPCTRFGGQILENPVKNWYTAEACRIVSPALIEALSLLSKHPRKLWPTQLVPAWAPRAVAGLALLLALTTTTPVRAIVLHPPDDNTSSLDRPPDGYVGSWGANASAVPIAPNYVITTRHQFVDPVSPNPTVKIAGVTYHFVEVAAHPTADLRVARITLADNVTPANLSTYAALYEPDLDGSEFGKTIVIGGFGRGRGTSLTTSGITWGYNWNSDPNTTQRWGANRVEAITPNFSNAGFTSDVLVDDFDQRNVATSVPFEAAMAQNDSGGGWFIKDISGTWKVAGLNAYVSHSGYSEFRDNPGTVGTIEPPDNNWAIRVGSYKSFIYSAFPGLFLKGDMNGDGAVDNFDIQDFEIALTDSAAYLAAHPTLTNYALRGDVNGDNAFDNFDIQPFEDLLTGSESPASAAAAVPEPGELVLVLAGLAGIAVWWLKVGGRKSEVGARGP